MEAGDFWIQLVKSFFWILGASLAAIVQVGCDNGAGDGRMAAFASISSTDPTTVRINTSGMILDIPRQFLDMPLNDLTGDTGVRVHRDILVVGASPDFAGRTSENLSKFSAPDSDHTVRVYMSSPTGMSVDEALLKLRGLWVSDEHDLSALDRDADVHIVEAKNLPNGFSTDSPGDIYLSPDGSITACNRAFGSRVSPNCQMFVGYADAIMKITFGASRQADRHSIRDAVVKTFDNWKVG